MSDNSDNNSTSSTETKRGRKAKYFSDDEKKKAKAKNQKQYYDTFNKKKKNYHCDVCNIDIDYYSKAKHLKTKAHARREQQIENGDIQVNNIKGIACTGVRFGKCDEQDAKSTLVDVIEIREFLLSGFCKKCQDKIFH